MRKENTKSKARIIRKVALLMAVLMLGVVLLSGCASGTSFTESNEHADDPATYWKDTTVEFEEDRGFLDTILSWLGTLIDWFTAIVPWKSYILALFIFAIVIEILMVPFGIKQQNTSRKQALLKPKEMAIRKKYAGRNDQKTQQRINQEIQELYQQENYNPMSGCLPLLIQLPIVMALYYVVIDPFKYVLGASTQFTNVIYSYMTASVENGGLGLAVGNTRGTIEMFSKMREQGVAAFEGIKNFCANGDAVFERVSEIIEDAPNFNIGSLNMGYVPSFSPSESKYWWLLAVPVLTFVAYYVTSKLQRKLTFQPTQSVDDRQQACSNTMMDIMMPMMSVFFTFAIPAAVGVYWIFRSFVGLAKQFILTKAMPFPKFTEEDYKAAERELAGKTPKKVEKSERVGTVRSLHHIDDEDYDEMGNYIGEAPEAQASAYYSDDDESESEAAPALPENAMTEGTTLKDDDRHSDEGEKAEKRSKKDKKKNKEKTE